MFRIRQVARQVVASSSDLDVVSLTLPSSATLATSNLNKYVFITSSGTSVVLTLPTATQGKYVCVRNSSSNPVTVNSTSIAVGESRTFVRVSGAWVLM